MPCNIILYATSHCKPRSWMIRGTYSMFSTHPFKSSQYCYMYFWLCTFIQFSLNFPCFLLKILADIWLYNESCRGNVLLCCSPGNIQKQTWTKSRNVWIRSLVPGQETVVLHRAGQRLWGQPATTRWSWLWYGLEACAGVVWPCLRGGFKSFYIFYVHPEPWGTDRNWRTYFSDGLQPPPGDVCCGFSRGGDLMFEGFILSAICKLVV